MKSDISQEHQEILDTDREKLAKPLNLEQLEQDGVISREGDWFRINSFESLPQDASNCIARLEQDDDGIKVQFLEQDELETIMQDFQIPES